MSKNLTLKGAAFGALVALGSTVIAGAPAFAVDNIATTLNSGTSFNTVTGYANELTLKTLISSTQSADDASLKYRVINAGAATIEAKFGVASATGVVDATTGDLYSYPTASVAAALLTDADATQGGAEIQTASKDFVIKPKTAGIVGDYTGSNLLALGVKDATTTDYTITVQPWLDVNGDNEINSTEISGAVSTLKFYDEKSVTATAAVTAPVAGADNVVAKITTTPELNGDQLGAEFISGKWTTQGNSNAVDAASTFKIAALAKTNGSTVWDATDKVWKSTAYLPYAVKAYPWSGNAVTFATVDLDASTAGTFAKTTSAATITKTGQAAGVPDNAVVLVAATAAAGTPDEMDGYFATGDNGATTTVLSGTFTAHTGPETFTSASSLDLVGLAGAYATVQAAGQYTVEAYLGAGKLATAGAAAATPKAGTTPVLSATVSENVRGSGNTYYVRPGTTNAVVTAPILDSSSVSVGAGVAATVRVTKTDLSTATGKVSSLTAGGKTLTDATTDGYIEYTTTTNADGKVVVTFSGTAYDEDTVVVKVTVAGANGELSDEVTLDFEDATIGATGLVDVAAAANGAVRNVVKGGSYTVEYALVDDYGKTVTETGYRVAATISTTAGGSADLHKETPFVNGRASVTFADDSTTTGVVTLTGTVEAKNSTDSWVGTLSTSLLTGAETETSTIHIVASNTATAVTATASATDSGIVSLVDWKNGDTRIPSGTFVDPAYDASAAGYFTIAGKVTDVYGLAVPGAPVTISASDVAFNSYDKVFTTGSITVLANATGDYTVRAYSHKAAATTFTVKSGAVTKTVSATFASTLVLSSTSVFSITTTEKINAGRTVLVKFAVKDKFGNAIKLNNGATPDQSLITVSYEGPGYLSATEPTMFVDDTGAASLLLITGPEDKGIGTFTLSNKGVDGANGTDAEKVDDVTVTKSILIGVTASVSAGKKLATAVVKNATGATVKVVSGAKVVSKVATSDSFKVSLTKLTAGKKTVKVYVNDILVSSKSVTVKK